MRISIHETEDDLGQTLAGHIFTEFQSAQSKGKKYLLGCPSGRSPKPVYKALAAMIGYTRVNLRGLILVMMDDYVTGTPPVFDFVESDRHFSCRRFATHEIAGMFNANLPKSFQLPPENIWFPDPSAPSDYYVRIAAAGGIDLFILASGVSDGHVAFNPRGSARNSVSYVAELAEQTRSDNLKTFPEFQSLDEVPAYGVTVGIGTIASQAKSAAMVLTGIHKRLAYEHINQAACYDPDWPASIIVECQNAVLYADHLAADRATK